MKNSQHWAVEEEGPLGTGARIKNVNEAITELRPSKLKAVQMLSRLWEDDRKHR